MKTLYLVRHAKSSWEDPQLKDIDRPLNKRGERDAPFMGKLMDGKGIAPNVLISSPANRAYTTAKTFAVAMDYPVDEIIINPEIYGAGVDDLLEMVQNLKNDWNSAMLFGHNMTYTMFANLYAKPALENVPTCGIVALEFNIKTWTKVSRGNGKLLFFEYPKKYFSK